MNIEELRDYCLAKKGVTEELPFDEDTLVFKVGGKMFALCSISEYQSGIALKCDPQKAIELREQYPNQVKPGYHMSKVHWNTVLPENGLPVQLICSWIDDSYQLVASKLTKASKTELGLL
ncbi:putative DNA-binding protein (MmcQ/YjbR family) [Pontibacter aydingkolensis]|uniref:MmcQ/YjbR family DNA-binding protein n=1 Tax=Pontibacter aydingkolensis TaxID=1911536 RepID=A0ABS7CZH8_9BACT|nr:MmcQ/YjbR family DNA-binding protein [Pontibacter aydingkolensis]MBW7469226.1 MmcQ/YjbR family DNA-binding protein [Pontibacter aydingkolensis]